MTCVLPLYAMVPEASFNGKRLFEGALPNSKIAQRIKEAMELSRDNTGAPSISSTWCRDILQCGQNQAMSSS